MADHAIATVSNPDSALTDFTLIVDLSDMPDDWWTANNTSDGTRGRVYKGDGSTRLACDWIDFDNSNETGLLRVKWSGTLATTGTQQLWIEPPVSGNDAVSASDTYGSDNAYDSNWEGYWPATDASGSLTDRTSNGRDASATGSPTYGVTGPITEAVDLSGVGTDGETFEAMATGDDPLSGSSATVMLWAEPDDLTVDQRAISRWVTEQQFIFWMDTGGSDGWAAILACSGGDVVAGTSNADATANTWQHAAFSYDSTNGLKVYVDGSQSATASANGTISAASEITRIGGVSSYSSDGTLFDGALAEIQIHSTERSAAWVDHEYDQTNDNSTFWGTWTWTTDDEATTLTVNDASHSHSLDTVGLTQLHNISVNNLQHSQSLATVSLTQRSDLSVAELKHTHTTDGVTVTQRHVLSLEDLQHVHTLDSTALTQLHNLSPADLQHAQSLDGVALSVAGVTTLILEDLLHSQAIDSVGLQQIGNITVADLLHTHSVDGVSLAGRTTITVADLAHTHALDGDNMLVQAHVLVVDDLGHTHSVGTVSLQQINLLVLQDLLHAHMLDRVSFSLAQGVVTITFSSEQPSVAFSSEQPSVDWSN